MNDTSEIKWYCEGCGAHLLDKEVEIIGHSYCHTIPHQTGDYDWEPQPCGPVCELPL